MGTSTEHTPWVRTPRTVAVTVAGIILAMLLADIMLICIFDSVQRFYYRQFVARGPWWILITVLAGALIGFYAAQLVLSVLYAALGDRSTPRRIIYTAFLLTGFTNVLVLFNMWYFPHLSWGDAVFVFLAPLFLFFLLQIPLFGIRSYFGWTIMSPSSAQIGPRRMSFTLAHLLGWFAFLAVPLCIMQTMNAPLGFELATTCFIAVSGYALLFVVLYLTLMVMIPTWKVIVGVTLASLAAIVAETAVIGLGSGAGPTLRWEILIVILAAHAVGGTEVVVCLLLARAFGFRLLKFGDYALASA